MMTVLAALARRLRRRVGEMSRRRKLALLLRLNGACMLVEFAYGFLSNSLGLTSDACHMVRRLAQPAAAAAPSIIAPCSRVRRTRCARAVRIAGGGAGVLPCSRACMTPGA